MSYDISITKKGSFAVNPMAAVHPDDKKIELVRLVFPSARKCHFILKHFGVLAFVELIEAGRSIRNAALKFR